jgi:hypothetical protein
MEIETKDLTSIAYDAVFSIFKPNDIYVKGKNGSVIYPI